MIFVYLIIIKSIIHKNEWKSFSMGVMVYPKISRAILAAIL